MAVEILESFTSQTELALSHSRHLFMNIQPLNVYALLKRFQRTLAEGEKLPI